MSAPPMVAALRVQLLHLPLLTTGSGQVHALERKDAAMLAMLALEGSCPAQRLARLMWPDSPERQARANLRQRLFRLRRLAQAELVHGHGAVQLAPELDVDLIRIARSPPDDPGAGAGELLGTFDYSDTDLLAQWVEAARRNWREQRAQRLAERASELEARRQFTAALSLAQRLVNEDPLHEHAHRRVMRLHCLLGDPAAALAAYRHCTETLAVQLGVMPSVETAQLAALVQAGALLRQPKPAAPARQALHAPRLCGRAAVWSRLEQAHDARSLLLLEGEPGIGKTRLLAAFAAARSKATVIGARPGEHGLRHGLLARLVQGLTLRLAPPRTDWVRAVLAWVAPELGAPASGRPSALRLRQALAAALDDWHAAGLDLLIIEDLQHADRASLQLLLALAADHEDQGIAWFFSARSGELPADAADWLDAQAPAVRRIALGPLELPGLRQLLDSLALPRLDVSGEVHALARHTGGNPLFVLETLQARGYPQPIHGEQQHEPCATPLPTSVGTLIRRRLAKLSPMALKLAQIAAIAGADFQVALATQLLGLPALDIAASWRELESTGVMRDTSFACGLLLMGTLSSMPQAIARSLHKAVAQVLQAADAPALRLAVHWAAAQDWPAASRAYETAAREALAASQPIEAARCSDEAARCRARAGAAEPAADERNASVEAH